jgi:hypothetical protein
VPDSEEERMSGKESASEALVRESIQEFGSLVAPSMQRSSVVAHLLIPGTGSRYRCWLDDGSTIECSASKLADLLGESLAAEAAI